MTTLKNKLFAIVLTLSAGLTWAQRNIDFVIPFAQGGTADRSALIVLNYMREELAPLGINPVLTYRPGASSILATASVASSDRLQIFMAPSGVITSAIVNPSAVTYDVKQDLVPLVYLGHVPVLLAVHSNSKFKTIQDLQRECQIRPITFGTAGVGSVTHIASAIVLKQLKCQSTHVPYKGVGPALTDLQGQHIDMVSDFVTSLRPRIEANVFRPLLSVDQHRNLDYPNLPSMSDIGQPDYGFYNWFTLSVGALVPAADVVPVRLALQRMIQRPDLKQQLSAAGLQGAGTKMPANFFAAEYIKLERIINGINLDSR